MVEVRTIHTAYLTPAELQAIRSLLDHAFGGDFADHDFEHALGGMHALIWDGDRLIGHGSVVMRRILHQQRALRTGFVEAVAVSADHRRQGHGGTIMSALEEIIRRAYDIGALSAAEAARHFYAERGWQLWTGTASVFTVDGIRRMPEEEGGIYLLPLNSTLDMNGDLACDWRNGDVW